MFKYIVMLSSNPKDSKIESKKLLTLAEIIDAIKVKYGEVRARTFYNGEKLVVKVSFMETPEKLFAYNDLIPGVEDKKIYVSCVKSKEAAADHPYEFLKITGKGTDPDTNQSQVREVLIRVSDIESVERMKSETHDPQSAAEDSEVVGNSYGSNTGSLTIYHKSGNMTQFDDLKSLTIEKSLGGNNYEKATIDDLMI